MLLLPFSSLLASFGSFLHGVNCACVSSQENLLEDHFAIVAGSEEVKQMQKEGRQV